MTLEEAAAILQISLPCSRAEARKAYLRLVKENKPDRAPEAFRRVREAWERLERAGDPIGARFVDPSDGVPPIDAGAAAAQAPFRAPEPDEGRESAAPAPTSFAAEPIAAPAPGPREPVDPVAPFRARIDALPRDATPEDGLAVAREAVASCPGAPDAHWLLYWQLCEAGQESEAVAALRAAWWQGHEGFFRELAQAYPSALSEDELRHAAGSMPAGERASVATELARRGLCDDALALALEDLAVESLPPWFSLYPYYHQILVFVRRNELRRASRLGAAIEEIRPRLGKGRDRCALGGLPADALCAELVEVAAGLPSALRNALVDAIEAGFTEPSIAAVEREARHFPEDARALLAEMKMRAPLLLGVFQPGLESATRAKKAGWFEGGAPGCGTLWLVVIVARFVIDAVSALFEPDHAMPELGSIPAPPAVMSSEAIPAATTQPDERSAMDAGVLAIPATEGAR